MWNGRCAKSFVNHENAAEAKLRCNAAAGDLLELSDEVKELPMITQLLDGLNLRRAWIGANSQKVWHWAMDSRLNGKNACLSITLQHI